MTAHFNSLNDPAFADICEGHVETRTRPGVYRNFGKRALELSIVILVAPFVALVTMILVLPHILKGERAFYLQRRVGRNGRHFVMWKIRTMVQDADERLSQYLQDNPSAREEWARHQKLRDDPRVTTYGRFLRKTSLDELPQLWNVLKGDMALIGPRPMMPHQRALYHGTAYYALRPGISGYWQVSDRNDAEFKSRVEFDELYDRTISFATDFNLIARTVVTVLRGTGV